VKLELEAFLQDMLLRIISLNASGERARNERHRALPYQNPYGSEDGVEGWTQGRQVASGRLFALIFVICGITSDAGGSRLLPFNP
jgi:hypothetical protein